MTFFYDLNKRLATLASKQDAEQLAENSVPASQPKSQLAQALNERDMGKHNNATTGFKALAKKAGGGNIEKGNRIAGAQLAKMRAKGQVEEGTCPACDCAPCKCDSMDESALQAYIGDKKYGKKGMDALRKAGREHVGKDKMDQIRDRYNKMDEADMEEGNAFTGALAKTPKGGKFKVGNKEFTDTSDLEEGFKEMDAWLASREKEKGTGRFDKKKISTGTVYTRKPETFDDPETDPEATGGAPKRRGRPKGKDKGPERVTAKSYKYKTGRPTKTKEGLDSDGVMMTRPTNCSSESIEHGEQAEYNDEAGMTKESLHTIVRHARELEKCLRDNENLPEWVQEKVGQIKGMMTSVTDYILSTHERDAEQHMEPMAEKAVSQAQRRAAGIAHAAQKGEIPKSKLRGASKEMAKMPQGELHKFAATKEKGLPTKVKEGGKPDFLDLDKDGNKTEPMKKAAKDKKEEKVDETTVAGSVATAPAGGKSKGGYNFGGGVYEGFNNQVESMITEGMNISVNMNAGEDGETRKSITVSAEGEEADQLAALLKMAGLHGQSADSCGTCGNTPCGCEQTVDEAYGDTDETLNNPDWPTDTEKLDAEPNLRTYSGGLNGPKSTGQTTIPVVASQERRQSSMEESVALERSLFKTWKNYKG